MSDKTQETTGIGELSKAVFSVPGLTILASVVALYFSHAGFDLARPPTERKAAQEPGGELKAESRSWQDPFPGEPDASDGNKRHEELARRSPESFAKLSRALGEHTSNGPVAVIVTVVNGSPYPHGVESRLRSRLVMQSAMRAGGFVRADSENIHHLVLPADFRPKGPTNWLEWIRATDTNCAALNAGELLLAYEWFERDTTVPSENSPYTNALVFWWKEDQFKPAPFLRIATLLAGLLERNPSIVRPNIALSLLGPRSSGGLKACLEDTTLKTDSTVLHTKSSQGSNAASMVRSMCIVSTTATAPDVFFSLAQTNDAGLFGPREQVSLTLSDDLPGSRFKHFGRTDDELCFFLLAELSMRGVDLAATPIVLLSEYDTFYGRALPLTFKAALEALKSRPDLMPRGRNAVSLLQTLGVERPQCGDLSAPAEYPALLKGFETNILAWRTANSTVTPNVLHYSFLAGVDGSKTVLDTPQKEDGEKKKETLSEMLERPEGEHQLDYIRRLADDLAQTLASKAGPGNDGRDRIAIGLLGADFYDKLLLLQALRDRLPNALFFTTDLDSRLTMHSQHRWSRNLVTVSSYGLSPPKEEGKLSLAAFRDAYQTAQFMGCRWILNTNSPFGQSELAAYEIGRERPHRLQAPSTNSPLSLSAVWAETKIRARQAPRALVHAPTLLVGVVGLAMIIVATLVPLFFRLSSQTKECDSSWKDRFRRFCEHLFILLKLMVGGLGGIALFLLLLWLMFYGGLEPLEVGDGVSALGSAILLLLASGLGLIALYRLWSFEQGIGDQTKSLWFILAIPVSLLLDGVLLWDVPLPLRGPEGWFRGVFLAAWAISGMVTVATAFFWLGLIWTAATLRAKVKAMADDPVDAAQILEKLVPIIRHASRVAVNSESLGRLLYYSMFAVLLLVMACSRWLDAWTWTPWMTALVALRIGLLTLFPLVLQNIASKIRSGLKRQTYAYQTAAKQGADGAPHSLWLNELVDKLDEGSFAPLAQQPVFGALAWVLGGSGIISLLQPLLTGHG